MVGRNSSHHTHHGLDFALAIVYILVFFCKDNHYLYRPPVGGRGVRSLQKMPTVRAWYFAFPNLSLLLWLQRFPQGLGFLLDPSDLNFARLSHKLSRHSSLV